MRPTVQAKLCTSSTYVPCLTGVRSIVVGGSGSRRSWSAGGASEDVVRGVRDDGVQHGAFAVPGAGRFKSWGTPCIGAGGARLSRAARYSYRRSGLRGAISRGTLSPLTSRRSSHTSSPVACMNLAVECSPGAVVRHAQRVRRDATRSLSFRFGARRARSAPPGVPRRSAHARPPRTVRGTLSVPD